MSAQEQARALMMRHHHLVKNRQQSLLSRAAAEVGMPTEDTASYLNNEPNAGFRAAYDRSSASLS